MRFHQSLSTGKQSEEMVLNRIQHKYPSAYIEDGYFKDYDIYIPEISTSVEVKKDFKSKYTGNVVVEVSMNGELSALSITRANWWVFHLDEQEFIWITPQQIKDMIHREQFDPVQFTGNGDYASKVAYLIKKEYFNLYNEI